MKLNFTVDVEDLQELDFDSIFTEELVKEVAKRCKEELGTDEFKKLSILISETIVAETKLKMENFLLEDISLTDSWGKTTFIGNIEDLIKKRFDDILLRPVDSSGKTMQGCTSSQSTWLEWEMNRILNTGIKNKIESAAKGVERECRDYIDSKIIEIKNDVIKKEIDSAFIGFLKK